MRFIPYAHLVPLVSVMVTQCGDGGVQCALAAGVPLVGAGTTEEKPEVANRIAWADVGVNLKTKSPTSEQVRRAVRTVLDMPSFRERPRRLQAEIAHRGGRTAGAPGADPSARAPRGRQTHTALAETNIHHRIQKRDLTSEFPV